MLQGRAHAAQYTAHILAGSLCRVSFDPELTFLYVLAAVQDLNAGVDFRFSPFQHAMGVRRVCRVCRNALWTYEKPILVCAVRLARAHTW